MASFNTRKSLYSTYRKKVKNVIRKEVREAIKKMTETDRSSQSFSVCNRILQSSEWQAASDVLLYSALSDELDIQLLFDDAFLNRKRVWLPVVVGNDLIIRQYIADNRLMQGAFGIEEPTENSPEISLEDKGVLLIIVPGRAFTKSGYRLGRGKGYYDRLFAQKRFADAKKIGVAFCCQIYDSIPVDAWDVKLDLVVSP